MPHGLLIIILQGTSRNLLCNSHNIKGDYLLLHHSSSELVTRIDSPLTKENSISAKPTCMGIGNPRLHCVTFLSSLQSNLDGSNTDGSFTMANSKSFLNPYEILLIAQENKYLRKFSYFIVKFVKLYVVCTH